MLRGRRGLHCVFWGVFCALDTLATVSWDNLRISVNKVLSGETLVVPEGSFSCTVVPESLKDELDVQTLTLYAPKIIQGEEDCLHKLVMLYADCTNFPGSLEAFLENRCDRVPEKTWVAIMSLIPRQETELFKHNLAGFINCIPYLEVLAPYLKEIPQLKGENAIVMLLLPVYYILKYTGPRSRKLQEEFKPILQAHVDDPKEFWKTLEWFLGRTKYVSRALADESHFFETNKWMIDTFCLDKPQLQEIILENDYHQLAYFVFQGGVDDRMLGLMISHSSYHSLALYLGRNQPAELIVNYKIPQQLQPLIRLYNQISRYGKQLIPCWRPENGSVMTRIAIDPSPLMSIELDRERATAIEMILKRLFDIPFKVIPEELLRKSKRVPIKGMNLILAWYCQSFELESAVKIVKIKAKAEPGVRSKALAKAEPDARPRIRSKARVKAGSNVRSKVRS